MAVHSKYQIDKNTIILIWEITESENFLLKKAKLEHKCLTTLRSIKHLYKRKTFLAIRCMLRDQKISSDDLFYNEFGKPYLKSGTHISISHSGSFLAIGLSNNELGVDVERYRTNLNSLANRFLNNKEKHLELSDYNILVFWCIKEAVFKMLNLPKMSFKKIIISETKKNNFEAQCLGKKYVSHQLKCNKFICVVTQSYIFN